MALVRVIEDFEKLRNHPMGLESLCKVDGDEQSYLALAMSEHQEDLEQAQKDNDEQIQRLRRYLEDAHRQTKLMRDFAEMSNERLSLKLQEEMARMDDHEYQPSHRLLSVIAGRLI